MPIHNKTETIENRDAPRKNGRNPKLNSAKSDDGIEYFSIIGDDIRFIIISG